MTQILYNVLVQCYRLIAARGDGRAQLQPRSFQTGLYRGRQRLRHPERVSAFRVRPLREPYAWLAPAWRGARPCPGEEPRRTARRHGGARFRARARNLGAGAAAAATGSGGARRGHWRTNPTGQAARDERELDARRCRPGSARQARQPPCHHAQAWRRDRLARAARRRQDNFRAGVDRAPRRRRRSAQSELRPDPKLRDRSLPHPSLRFLSGRACRSRGARDSRICSTAASRFWNGPIAQRTGCPKIASTSRSTKRRSPICGVSCSRDMAVGARG